MTCQELAEVVEGLRGNAQTKLGVLLDDAGQPAAGDEAGEVAAAGKGSRSNGGGSDGRLLRQTTVSVARLESRVTDLEEKVAHTMGARGGGGGGGSVLGSRLDRLPYGLSKGRSAGAGSAGQSGGGWEMEMTAPSIGAGSGAGMETRARDLLEQSLQLYGTVRPHAVSLGSIKLECLK